jgi:hypothetical protein
MLFFKIFLTPAVFTLFFLLIFPLASSADTVTTPFAFSLSAESALAVLGGQNLFNAPSGELKTNLPNETLATPYAVAISGIHLTVDYAFTKPVENGSLAEWNIQSKNLSADLVVDLVDASQTIVETSGGTTLNVRINATCTNVHLALPAGATTATGTLDLSLQNGVAAFLLNHFQANWQPGSWQIISMNCVGPQGFGDLVKQDITTQLQNINPFLSTITTQIQNQLSAIASSAQSWTFNSNDNSGTSVTLQPNQATAGANSGAILVGTATFNFPKLNQTACQKTITTAPTVSTTANLFSLPIEAIQQLISCSYLNQSLLANFTSQDFPAFQSLLSDWFLKIIVWPNLVHFNGHSIFNFTLAPTTAPTIGKLSSDDQTLTFNVDAPLELSVYAPTAEGSQHYVDFFTQISGPAYLSIQDGDFIYQQSTAVSLTDQFDPKYVQEYHPEECVWRSVIAHDLRKYLANGVSTPIPALTVPHNFTLAPQSLTTDGTNVNVAFGIQSEN